MWMFMSVQIKDTKNARYIYIWLARCFVVRLRALDIFVIIISLSTFDHNWFESVHETDQVKEVYSVQNIGGDISGLQ